MSPHASNVGGSKAAAPSRTPRFAQHRRTLCLAGAFCLFLVATLLALLAPLRPDVPVPGNDATASPRRPAPLMTWDGWRYPFEINAARRLPVLDGDLIALAFAPNTEDGWLLGGGNVLLRTRDGGATWTALEPQIVNTGGASNAKAASVFSSRTSRWPLASILPLAAAPAYKDEKTQNAPAPAPANKTAPPNVQLPPNSGVYPTQQNTLRPEENAPQAVTNGGPAPANVRSWRDRDSELNNLVFSSASLGRAVSGNRRFYRTEDGGQTWRPDDSSGVKYDEVSLLTPASTLVNGTFWQVDREGLIATGTDPKNLRIVLNGAGTELYAIRFLDTKRGWVAGEKGTLLRTIDGGATWFPAAISPERASQLGRYIWLPPPLYALALAGIAGLVVVSWRIPLPAPPPRASVEDILLSDRPLEPGEPDVLGFQRIAAGLSHFLRNTRTEPPLTLAITGEWGSGKSSLMNLLRGDLRRHGLRPVWFNAWHHQTEERLLAALLENIRSQAVPGWFSDGGLSFRIRLFLTRLHRDWARWAIIGGVFVFSAAFVASNDDFSLDGSIDLAEAVLRPLVSLGGDDSAEKTPEARRTLDALRQPGALVAVLSLLAGLVKIVGSLRAFGVKPSSLLSVQAGNSRLKDLDQQTSFRHRFSLEFAEVTHALGSRRMVIFIDDLDRCQPQQIYEMLESSNFLVSCGDCFVVLGLARERIERAIGHVFKEVAVLDGTNDTFSTSVAAPPLSEAERQHRFAQQYLEKLINIEVPVPRPGQLQYQQLLRARREAADTSTAAPYRLRLGDWWPVFAVAGLVAGLGLAGFIFGRVLGVGVKKAPRVTMSAPAAPIEPSTTGRTPGLYVARFEPSDASRGPSAAWWFLPLGVTFAGAVLWRLRTKPAVAVVDSNEFTGALNRWLPILANKPGVTPRSLKRFANRVRYHAMIQRAHEPQPSRWEALGMRLDAWWRRLRGQPVSVSEPPASNIAPPVVGEIDEASLVTLSAWYDSVADGTVTDELQRAAAAIDDKIKQRFLALRAGLELPMGASPAK